MRRVLAASVVLAMAACSRGGDTDEEPSADGPAPTTTAAVPTVGEPTLRGPVTGGSHGFPQTTTPVDIGAAGYVEEEFFLSGQATSYRYTEPPRPDGDWLVEPEGDAPFTTRILVRRPEEPDAFNGAVVVEWLNVTSNVDVDVDFGFFAEEVLREGYAWVGVTAQQIAVDSTGGGPFGDAAVGLRAWDPQRYGNLDHPGDDFAYDIFSQAGAVLRTPEGRAALGGVTPELILADGESQSAFRMATYVNAVDPVAQVFDGFLIHSRDGGAAPLDGRSFEVEAEEPPTTRLRTDGDAPVLQVITESDLFTLRPDAPFPEARQADGDRIRTWEVAGTAHSDATYLRRLNEQGTHQFEGFLDLSEVIPFANDGPQRFVMRAALHALRDWAADGPQPPTVESLQVVEGAIARDEHGNALGGLRTPPIDVPTATLTGEGTPIGSTTPFTLDQLRDLYGTRDAYLSAYRAATEVAVAAGFILAADAAALNAEAEAVAFD